MALSISGLDIFRCSAALSTVWSVERQGFRRGKGISALKNVVEALKM